MSIIDHQKLTNHICDWIKNYATNAGISTLVFNLSEDVDSALVALLCRKTALPMLAINTYCSTFNTDYTAELFAKDYNIPFTEVKLNSAYDNILEQCYDFIKGKSNIDNCLSGLQASLNVSVLSYAARAKNGLIIGGIDRSDGYLIRNFHKYGDGSADIFPIIDLFKSEVYDLFVYLAKEMRPTKEQEEKSIREFSIGSNYSGDVSGLPKSAIDIIQAKQNIEDIGLSYADIEWGDREDEKTLCYYKTGIIANTNDPVRHPAWASYIGRQKTIIAKMHGLEKTSSHKIITTPRCSFRMETEGLVR
jgi:NAD+ synthetase